MHQIGSITKAKIRMPEMFEIQQLEQTGRQEGRQIS
jgi:hypothetical protein